MTCIVGITHNSRVYIGADSAAASERWDLQIRADSKIFRNGDFIMGFTSSFRMGQLLAYAFEPPKRHEDRDIYAFMVTDFINSVRECFKNGGVAKRQEEVEQCGTFLVGYEGRLFKIIDDYQVAESVDGFDACGSGDLAALGALYATRQSLAKEPETRIQEALKAAEKYSVGVRSPFKMIATELSPAAASV